MEVGAVVHSGAELPIFDKNLQGQHLAQIKKERQDKILSFLQKDEISIRDFIDTFEGRLTEDKIREKLHNRNIKSLLREICKSREKCLLGLYVLQDEIMNEKKWLYNDVNIWTWLDTVTSLESYSLQEENIDDFLLAFIDEKSHEVDNKFIQILRITENNASSNSLKVLSRLMSWIEGQLQNELNAAQTNIIGFKRREEDVRELQSQSYKKYSRKASNIFETLNKIVKKHTNNKSPAFYLEMNPEEIESIFNDSKKIFQEDNKINWREPTLHSLIEYYVAFTTYFMKYASIASLSEKWKLQKIFETAYDSSTDINLQEKILESFSSDNTYLPFLPINIVESTFDQSDEIKLEKIIVYLKEKYKLTSNNEQNLIRKLNDKIIFNPNKNIKAREAAFRWFYDVCPEKDKWCSEVLKKILPQNNPESVQKDTAFTDIVKDCFDTIRDKQGVKNQIVNYLVDGKNEIVKELFYKSFIKDSDLLDDLISEIIDTNKTNKIDDIVEYLSHYMKTHYMKPPASSDSVIKKSFLYLCKHYQSPNFGVEKKDTFKEMFVMYTKDKKNRLEEFLDNIPENEKSIILEDINLKLFSEENTVEFNIYLLYEYIKTHIKSIETPKIQQFINYLWKNKQENTYLSGIIDIICASKNQDAIKYLVTIAWS